MAEQDTNTAQAAAQTNGTSGQAAGEGDSPQDGGNGNGGDKGKPFTPEQEQYIGSWLGRIVAKQFDEKVVPHLRQNQPAPAAAPVEQDEALKKFNEKVIEKFLGGDPVGAMEMVENLRSTAKKSVTEAQGLQLMRQLTTYADKPYYEDINDSMQKLAKEKVSSGWPVEAALKASYAEAKADFLEGKVTGEKEHGNLNLTGGGRQNTNRNKPVKLPPEYEKACARDIADGLFKTRDEWIKVLNPKIKERIGI